MSSSMHYYKINFYQRIDSSDLDLFEIAAPIFSYRFSIIIFSPLLISEKEDKPF